MMPWMDDDKKHIMDIYTKLQLEKGDYDLKGKVETYEDIFEIKSRDGHPIIRAILRGLAGLGKTTLLDKIAYDWACGSVAVLKKYKLVFVLKMHSLTQDSDVIDSVFDQLLDEKDIDREELKSFITTRPDEVLFLLDGFDEFKTTELDETKFGSLLKMLNRKGEYDKCSVLVTTRPSHYDKLAKGSLIERPFVLVNVLGFNKDDIEEYVHKFYSEESFRASGLLERIKSSEVLYDLARSPMILLLMCLLWRVSSELPDTMSRLYDEALKYIFKRKIKMISPEEISKLIIAIGKVALRGLLASDQTLSFREEDFDPDVLRMAIRAGILTSQRVQKKKSLDTSNSVYFIHKTFQEFCAAKFFQSEDFSEKDDEQFAKFFHQTRKSVGFDYLLRFCCGDKDGRRTNSILQFLLDKVEHAGILHDGNLQLALNCYFESQSQTLPPLQLINSVLAYTITIRDFSSDYFTSLMYFFKNVTDHTKADENAYFEKVHSLEIHSVVARESSLLRFGAQFACYVNKMTHLSELNVDLLVKNPTGQRIERNCVLEFSSLRMNELTQLKNVKLYNFDFASNDTKNIVGALSHIPNLYLNLSDNVTLTGSGDSWTHLAALKNVGEIKFSSCNLKGDDVEHIAMAVSNLTNLVKLDLSRNKTLAGSCSSWSSLAKMKNIQQLCLSACKLTWDDMDPISAALSNMPNLVELDLSYNKNLTGSCGSWSQFENMRSIKKLILSGCSLEEDNIEHIVMALGNMPNLLALDLSSNMLRYDGEALSHLKKIKNLQNLDLGYCKLTGDHIEHIARALKNMSDFVELDLSHNPTLSASGGLWSQFSEIKNIQVLKIISCNLTVGDMGYITMALSKISNLDELDLTGNQALGGSDDLWSHLAELKTIRKLCLRSCNLIARDMEHIAVALSNLPNLEELDLSYNEMLAGSSRSWSHLAQIKALGKLVLSCCKLKRFDIKYISAALSNMPNLVELDLSGNFTLAEARRLWSLLTDMKQLQILSLKSCDLTADDKSRIRLAQSQMTNLVKLEY
ncbi:NLR family CARD domain-containing protein 4-like [Patiria miniata]|uniref:NACHT domain-containing protein n=1 Tax=Patiria miniata TaxID=46514 RepID=A0A914B5K6_PATMI|nr:NLR family CARD domain-containing protein 4-like [Patiria miniata]